MAKIVINLALRQLYYYENENLVKVYPVAIGKPATPTPTGDWQVIAKIDHPGGILGTRWLGLNIPDGPYGVHGTPHPWSIGKAISLGCVRMYNQDVEELFQRVKVGTSVNIISSWAGSNTNTPAPEVDAPTSPAADSVPASNGPGTYRVQSGDSLWSIAQRFNVSLDDLIEANQLSNPNRLSIGQQLTIPGQ